MAALPKIMKAWIAVRPGAPAEVLKLRTDWPVPAAPKAGEIMIKVSYVSLNPLDPKLMGLWLPFKHNTTTCADFVGQVVQVGPLASSSSSNIQVGMTVAGIVPTMMIFRGIGSLVEYLVVPANAVAEKPKGLNDAVAAGLMGICGQSVANILRVAGLHAGDKVLVNGASGGVGSALVQVLHGMGMHVTGICSSRNVSLVRKLGAEEVVDYTAHESLFDHLASMVSEPGSAPFDAIVDCVGNPALYRNSPKYLKPEGQVTSIAGGFGQKLKFNYQPVMLGGTPRKYNSLINQTSGALAQETADWFEKGVFKEVVVDSTFDMKDALEGFAKLLTNRAVGKIFIKVT